MNNWITVCTLDELQAGLGVCAQVEGHQIALFSMEGRYFALDNFDPFSQTNVLSRGITGDLNERLVVASPIYKQHFDLETGQCLEDENVCLRTYPVKAFRGLIQVLNVPMSRKAA